MEKVVALTDNLLMPSVTSIQSNGDIAIFQLFDDFVDLMTSDRWLLRQAGGVGGSATLVNAEDEILGGILALAVSATNNHKLGLKLVDGDTGGSWKITKDSGKKLWFAIKVKVLQVADLAMYVGLFNPEKITTFGKHVGKDDTGEPEFAAAPDGWTDGIYFRILCDASDEIDFAHAKDSVEAEVQPDIQENDGDWHILGFFFDGVNTITPTVDGVPLPDYAVHADADNFPHDLGLLPRIYIQTGEGVIKTLKVDWIKVIQER